MKKLTAIAPTRIDLAGGTLDLPPLFLFHTPTVTINIATSVFAHVEIEESTVMKVISRDLNSEASFKNPEDISWREHPKLELILRLVKSFALKENVTVSVSSDAPHGSGLGASSVLATALTAALAEWRQKTLSPRELVEWALSIETQVIKVPAGYQDFWGAVYGGVHAYERALDGNLIRTPLGSPDFRKKLEEYMLLVYTGTPHFSGMNNWQLFKQHIDGDAATVTFFEVLKDNALEMKTAFANESIPEITEALNKDWLTRKAMLPTMSTPEIDKLTEEAMKIGGLALRVCGAGGGGCALLLVEPTKKADVAKLAEGMGMKILSSKIAETGVKTEWSGV
jgi:D-glycero-alpha-D-manno-heptose-7-phosphate kinase